MSIDKLQTKIRKLKNPVMVDLTMEQKDLPISVLSREGAFLPAYETVCTRLLEALAEFVPAVRMDFGLFALNGAAGLEVLERLLKLATEKIEESSVVRVIDGVLAAILYLIIGVAVVAVFWGALYLLDYCGLFYTSDAFNEYSFLSEEFFEVAEKYLKSFADKYFFKLKAK